MPTLTLIGGSSARSFGVGSFRLKILPRIVTFSHDTYNSDQQQQGIVLDSSKNMYFVNAVSGFSTSPSSYAGTFCKTNPNGTSISASGLIYHNASSGTYQTSRIALDSSNNIYIAGSGSFKRSANNEYFGRAVLAKYNNSGTLQFNYNYNTVEYYGGSGFQEIKNAGSAGLCFAGTIVDSSSSRRGCVGPIDTAGNVSGYYPTGTFASGTVSESYCYSVDVDSSGNFYACGELYSSGNAKWNPWFAKFNSSWTLQWARGANASYSNNGANQITVDPSGNVYSAGYYMDGPSSFYSTFIVKYNASGTRQWSKGLHLVSSASYSFTPISIESDSSGVYVLCRTGGSNYYVYLIKYDPSGNVLFINRLFRTSTPTSWMIPGKMFLDEDNLLISGSYLNASGRYRSFIFRVPTDGTKTGTYTNDISWTYESSSLSLIGDGALTWATPSLSFTSLGINRSSATSDTTATTPTVSVSAVAI